MSERDALLRAVLESPDDDAPRLVYADWLEEHGEPEGAEFIRVQCELAKDEGLLSPDSRASLRKRERALLASLRDGRRFDLPATRPEISPYLSRHEDDTPDPYTARMDRGFTDKVVLPLAVFTGQAAALFGAHPIASVAITDREPLESVYLNQDPHSRWLWIWNSTGLQTAADLPAELFDRLESFRRRGNDWAGYPSFGEALDALSAVCVAYGRELACLPALTRVRPPRLQNGR